MKTLAWMTVAAAGLAIAGCNITGKYSLGGTLTGLMGQGLALQDNSGNDLDLASNGAFVFTDTVSNGDAYSVTVRTQPSNPAQTCTVHNGSGAIDKAELLRDKLAVEILEMVITAIFARPAFIPRPSSWR